MTTLLEGNSANDEIKINTDSTTTLVEGAGKAITDNDLEKTTVDNPVSDASNEEVNEFESIENENTDIGTSGTKVISRSGSTRDSSLDLSFIKKAIDSSIEDFGNTINNIELVRSRIYNTIDNFPIYKKEISIKSDLVTLGKFNSSNSYINTIYGLCKIVTENGVSWIRNNVVNFKLGFIVHSYWSLTDHLYVINDRQGFSNILDDKLSFLDAVSSGVVDFSDQDTPYISDKYIIYYAFINEGIDSTRTFYFYVVDVKNLISKHFTVTAPFTGSDIVLGFYIEANTGIITVYLSSTTTTTTTIVIDFYSGSIRCKVSHDKPRLVIEGVSITFDIELINREFLLIIKADNKEIYHELLTAPKSFSISYTNTQNECALIECTSTELDNSKLKYYYIISPINVWKLDPPEYPRSIFTLLFKDWIYISYKDESDKTWYILANKDKMIKIEKPIFSMNNNILLDYSTILGTSINFGYHIIQNYVHYD